MGSRPKKPAIRNAAVKWLIHVRVLQNGFPIAETQRPFGRSCRLAISSSPIGELAIPLYPLAESLSLIEANRQGTRLSLDAPWAGVVCTAGTTTMLDGRDRSERCFTLQPNDYASLQLDDLRVMIKIAPKAKPEFFSADPAYRAKLLDLFFADRDEKLGLLAAVFLAFATLTPLCLALAYYQVKRPSRFEELAPEYTLPFISATNLTTSPEALQTRLDRTKYISSVVGYYRSLTEMMMGWAVSEPKYLFPSSLALYQRLHAEGAEHLAKAVATRTTLDRQRLAETGSSLLSLPAVYGESFQERLLMMMDKMTAVHASFRLSLDYRRATTAEFLKDPSYSWNDYLGKNKSLGLAGSSTQEIAKISVFEQLTDEQAMYLEAEKLGKRAKHLQTILARKAQKNELLTAAKRRTIYVPADLSHTSFLHSAHLGPSATKLQGLQGSAYGADKQALKEPLIGRIDSKVLERTVSRHRFQLNLCYEMALRRNQALEGRMDWAWRIDSRGKISDIALVKTTLRDHQMIECVRKELASWTFPRPARGSVKVFHAFTFKPQNG